MKIRGAVAMKLVQSFSVVAFTTSSVSPPSMTTGEGNANSTAITSTIATSSTLPSKGQTPESQPIKLHMPVPSAHVVESPPASPPTSRRLRSQSDAITQAVNSTQSLLPSSVALPSAKPKQISAEVASKATNFLLHRAVATAPVANSSSTAPVTNTSSPTAPVANSSSPTAAVANPSSSTAPVASSNSSAFHDPCSCEFKGICSCQASIDFMDCIAAACNSGKCDCQATQFQHACFSIAGVCTSLEMQCSADRASCLVEREAQMRHENSTTKEAIYEKLQDLKERRCRLEIAADDGWLNAESRLVPVRKEIDELTQELQRRFAPLPEMHCEKHFEEWHYPEPQQSRSYQVTTQLALALLLVRVVGL